MNVSEYVYLVCKNLGIIGFRVHPSPQLPAALQESPPYLVGRTAGTVGLVVLGFGGDRFLSGDGIYGLGLA